MNLSVLIGTCDKYEPLWETFQICFNKYWTVDTQNVFVSETKEVPNFTSTKFSTILAEGDWGNRIIQGISEIKSDYIFFILDDYFFNYTYSKDVLERYVRFCTNNNIDRLQVSPSEYQIYTDFSIEGYTKFSPMSQYQISMQPSIWSKSFLLDALNPFYSPWDFEIKESTRLIGQSKNIFIDRSIPSPYFNAVRKGMKKSPGWNEFFAKENIKEPTL